MLWLGSPTPLPDHSDNSSLPAQTTDPQLAGPLHTAERAVLTLLAVTLSLVASVSNGLLIYVIVRTGALHTATNCFIVSLAAGELMTTLFVIPFAGSSTTTGAADAGAGEMEEGWAFAAGLCPLVGLASVLGPGASAFSLLAVSADRYLAISRPLSYGHLVNKLFTATVIAGLWLFSLLISLLPLGGWGSYSFSSTFRTCLMRSSDPEDALGGGSLSHGHEVVVKEAVCVFLPIALIALTVVTTAHRIRGQRRVFTLVPVSMAATSVLLGGHVAAKANASRTKATRTLLLVSATFLTMCVPGAVVEVLCHSRRACLVVDEAGSPAALLRFFLWLSFLSCAVNPLILMGLNGKFRAALRLWLCRRRRWRLCGALVTSCGSLVLAADDKDKDPFTVSSGLHAVLEASLLLNCTHGAGRQYANFRRQVIMTLHVPRTSQLQLQLQALARLSSEGRERAGEPGRSGLVQLMTLRRTQSSPDLPRPADATMTVGGTGGP